MLIRASHFVDPEGFRLRRDVTLTLHEGRAAEIAEGASPTADTVDFEAAVILPGFVNAHAHLDLSHLHRQVPRGLDFADWIAAVVSGRQVPESLVEEGIERGCRMLLAGGTTAVIDISVDGRSISALGRHGLRGVAALEVLGLDPEKADAAMVRADEAIRRNFGFDAGRLGGDVGHAHQPGARSAELDYGFSPHAPWTTSPTLYEHAFGRAFGEGRLVTTHVAETREEVELLRNGSGPLRELLERLGAPVDRLEVSTRGPIARILDDWLAPWLLPGPAGNPKLMLVHANYPAKDDLEALARVRPSVCYCPRAHAWFGREPWPIQAMRDAGVNLLLGTDSLAGNVGLDMPGEIAAARAAHPDVPAEVWIRAATVNGRRALGLAADVADFTVLGLPARAAETDLAGLLDAIAVEPPPVYATVVGGRVVARHV